MGILAFLPQPTMASGDAEEDGWSDPLSSSEAEAIPTTLQPRQYQYEMFRESLAQNTIVTVGFTEVLVIEADVATRCPQALGKRSCKTFPPCHTVRMLERPLTDSKKKCTSADRSRARAFPRQTNLVHHTNAGISPSTKAISRLSTACILHQIHHRSGQCRYVDFSGCMGCSVAWS